MKNALLFIRVLLCAAVLHGCISKNDIEVEIPLQQKDIIVECYLTPGYPAELTLIESSTLEGELRLQTLGNAKAYIATDSALIQLQDVTYRNANRQIFVNYSCKDTIKNDHSFFNLDITTNQGIKLLASTSIISPVQMQNISLTDDRITVHHNINNGNELYFKLVASTYKRGQYQETKFELFHQRNSLTDPCTLLWKDLKAKADSIVVTLFNIQKDYYDYLLSARYAKSAYRDPFLTPEGIKSNIKGGIGIFTYYTFDKRSISL
jgi:hypothetical protein